MHDEIPDFPAFSVLQTLSAALARAVQSYQRFSNKDPGDTAKDFTAHHNACKAALGHIASLVKLNEQWRKYDRSPDSNDSIETLLQQARDILITTENHHDHQENQF